MRRHHTERLGEARTGKERTGEDRLGMARAGNSGKGQTLTSVAALKHQLNKDME